MGKIVISANATLDGVVQDPDGQEGFELGGWFHRFGGDDIRDWVIRETAEVQSAEALLLGRRTGEWFTARMSGADVRVSPEWANRMNSIPKYVVSSTLEDLQWDNTTILSGDAVTEVSELVRKVDGEILVYGSYRLVRTLLEHNLVDELRLVAFPAVLGTGTRLFDEISDAKSLRLLETRRIGEGLLYSTYATRRSDMTVDPTNA